MRSVLFIGGVCDGEWRTVRNDCKYLTVWKKANGETEVYQNPSSIESEGLSIERETYMETRFAGARSQFSVMMLGHMTSDEAFARLLLHYRPHVAENTMGK